MKVSAKIIGSIPLIAKLKKLEEAALTAQRKTVTDATLLIHENAVKSIQENTDGGTRVVRYDPYRLVTPSDPGDPPNTDTGRLVQSIRFEFIRKGMVGRVGTNLKYGAYLEFGTLKMAARPWLQPAVDKAANEIIEIAKKNTDEIFYGEAKKK